MKKMMFLGFPFACLLLLSSCNENHQHNFTKLVDKHESGHIYECDCGEKQTINHAYGDWNILIESTEDKLGKKERICEVCDYIDQQDIEKLAHQHQFAKEWLFDEQTHYNQAICGHSDVKGNEEQHQYVDGACTTCGVSEDISLFTFKTTKSNEMQAYASITGFHGSTVTSIHFPKEYRGLPVQEVDSAVFQACQSLENVYFEGGLEAWCKIRFLSPSSNPMFNGKHFFLKNDKNEWEEVTKLTIPNTIESIKDNQFYGFENVTEVTMESVNSIGTSAFMNCSKLNIIELPAIKRLEHNVFTNCSSLESIVIPNGVEFIGANAFDGCLALESITLYGSVKTIEEQAFASCNNLVNVYYDGTIEDWCQIDFDEYGTIMKEQSTFYLKNDTIWEKVTTLIIPNTVTKIKNYQFQYFCQITDIVLADSITEIGDYAFFNCINISSITIPDRVESIGQNAFSICENLRSIVLPKSLKSVGEYCFLLCKKLTTIYYKGTKEEFDLANLDVTLGFVYYYSEDKPLEEGKYWHYLEGNPTKWI